MIDSEFILKAKDFIENFDEKNITFVCLTVLGRAGSLLLHSLLDSHEQVLTIPNILPLYQNTSDQSFKSLNLNESIEQFFSSSIFETDWFYNKLGENKDESLGIDYQALKENFINIFEVVDYNRKNFILVLHLAYAKCTNINIDNIKVIVLHEHYLRSFFDSSFIRNDSFKAYFKALFNSNVSLYDLVLEDFKNVKFLCMKRHPFESYISFKRIIFDSFDIIPSDQFWKYMTYLFTCYRDMSDLLIQEKQKNRTDFMLIEFSDIHKKTKEIMMQVSDFINIDYSDKLLLSTFNGKMWWGNSPKMLMNGTTKERNFNEWITILSDNEIKLLNLSLGCFLEKFDYEKINSYSDSFHDLYFISNEDFEGFIYNLFLYSNTHNFEELYDNKFYLWIELYPILRKYLFSFLNNSENLDLLNNDISYNNVDFCIQYKFDKNSILSNSYIIAFQAFPYTSITFDQLEYLNEIVDQVWVCSEFTKKNYIDSGVIPNKIKVIPYGTDIEKSKAKLPPLHKDLLEDTSFKFLFQGDLNDISLVKNIIDVFTQTFASNKNVSLILLNSEYSSKYEVKSKIIPNKDIINIINNISDLEIIKRIKLFFDYVDISSLDNVFKVADCFIYPFINDSTPANLLRAIRNNVPVIVSNAGTALDFCNEENSFLIDCEVLESDIKGLNGSSFVNEHKNFVVNKEHFSKLMNYVYNNKLDAKEKAVKAYNVVNEKYNWKNTINCINENIQELKNKPVLRFNKEEIINDLEKKAKNYFNEKNYKLALETYYELSKYNSSSKYTYNLGLCNFHLCNYDVSLDYFIDILEETSPYYELLNIISENLILLDDYENASFYKERAEELLKSS